MPATHLDSISMLPLGAWLGLIISWCPVRSVCLPHLQFCLRAQASASSGSKPPQSLGTCESPSPYIGLFYYDEVRK